MVSRGDVWLVLSETDAAAEPHPCVVLSPPEIHDHLGLVTVAPTAPAGKAAAYRIPLRLDGQDRLIQLERIRTVEKRALTRQVGAIEPQTLNAALAVLREMFAE